MSVSAVPPAIPPGSGQQVYAPYRQSFQVPYDYPVFFTRDLFAGANQLLAEVLDRLDEGRRHRTAVFLDAGVTRAHPDLLRRVDEYFHGRRETLELAAPPHVVDGGEAAKSSWTAVREVMSTLGNLHLDRQSPVVAVGGGSVLDMVGFAVSIVHRGLRLVRLPTTTLAQDDAGLGVKNGMNEHGQKNFVGTFAPPFAVINDFSFLPTLTFENWIGGVAEAFKVAIIKDSAFFDFLCTNAARLRQRDLAVMEKVVHRAATLHLDHIRTSGDPFEFGSARPLDFGHWAAHKVETLSSYEVGHGQAVAAGIALDSCYALSRGLLRPGDLERILDGLQDCGLPIFLDCMGRRTRDGHLTLLDGLEDFREHLGGRLNVTLPDGLGRRKEVHHIDAEQAGAAVEFLRKRAS